MQIKQSNVIEIEMFDKNTISNVSERMKALILMSLNKSESKKSRYDTSSADL